MLHPFTLFCPCEECQKEWDVAYANEELKQEPVITGHAPDCNCLFCFASDIKVSAYQSSGPKYINMEEILEMMKTSRDEKVEVSENPDACATQKAETSETGFTKFDTSKTRLELIEPNFINGVGQILTYGAQKYSPNNWKSAGPEDIERIKGAAYRHFLAYLGGQQFDPETGLPHIYHASCNLMFLDYFDNKRIQNES